MSKVFKKQIFQLGKHLVSDAKGNRYEVEFTEDRVLKLINNFNGMRARGLRIPAPYEHDVDSVPIDNIDDLLSSKNNGGEWISFFVEDDSLWGNIKAATDQDEERIGNNVKGCSVFIDKYEYDADTKWDEAFLHVALTNSPVAVAENFQEDQSGLAIAMSTSIKSGGDPSLEMQGLTDVLKRKLKIEFPAISDVCEFLRMVTGILSNFNMNGDNTTTHSETPMEIMMSTSGSKKEETSTRTPDWEKRARTAAKELVVKNEQLTSLVKHMSVSYKQGLESRLTTLSEVLEKDEDFGGQVKDILKSLPELELEFDFEKSELVRPVVEDKISMFETIAKRITPEKKDTKIESSDFVTQQPPTADDVFVPEGEVDSILASM